MGLNKVSLPAVRTIHGQAFMNASIAEVDLPWDKLEAIGVDAFKGSTCYPQNLVLSKVTAMSNGVFAGASSARNTQLRSISLPMWTGSSLSELGFGGSSDGIFSYCTALTSVDFPMLQSVPSNLFYYCSALEEVKLSKVTTINSSAFNYCSKLKKLEIGGAITKMSSAFLNNCSAFQTLILRGITQVPTIASSTFSSSQIGKKTAYVYVPKEFEEMFKVANYWSNYATQIRAIEDYPEICGS